MQIHFWGTRGSLPVAANGRIIREKIKQALLLAQGQHFEGEDQIDRFINEAIEFPVQHGYGGDSSCIQIIGGDAYMLCDMGTGLRRFGQHIMQKHGPQNPQEYHFFMSHVHWDHIMGFPFFPPAYIPGNTVHIYGGHSLDIMEAAFRRQQSSPCFPVYWDQLGADIHFTRLKENEWSEINGFRVKLKTQNHHGTSFGYRFEENGKALVYATDAEHDEEDEGDVADTLDFFQNADVVVFDAMYSLADMITIKEDWGHSSNVVGVDLCLRAKVKHYCMFHHEPAYNDEMLFSILQETRRYAELVQEDQPLHISAAYDDMIIEV